jgi:hypothetical protein
LAFPALVGTNLATHGGWCFSDAGAFRSPLTPNSGVLRNRLEQEVFAGGGID